MMVILRNAAPGAISGCRALQAPTGSSLPGGPNVDLAVNVGPLLRLPQAVHQPLEGRGILRRVLEPRQEVEWLPQVPPVVQTPRHGRQVLEPPADVVGALFQYGPPLVLGEVPPGVGLADGDERGPGGLGPPEGRLSGGQRHV